ncbi:MAG: capsule assembly Wzi family protein [Muribaculaceae bacterium]|nr:capsule assembly Wzi family protein [Muribaculaceae bacterium]
MIYKKALCCIAAVGIAVGLLAAELPADSVPPGQDSTYRYRVELNGALSTGEHTPFWLVNNRFGLGSIKKTNGYLRAQFIKEERHDKPFTWDFGADLAVAGGYTSTFIIQQLYGAAHYRCLDLTVGSKEMASQMVNPELSSGDMLFSANARPIPQIRIGIDRYTYIPWTKRLLAVRGYVSFGMFTDERYQKNTVYGPAARRAEHVLFHSKGLFLRWGNPDRSPITVEGGLEMAAQWGGTVYLPDGQVLKMGKDIWKVFFPSGDSERGDETLPTEVANVQGNHVGQWCAAIGYHRKGEDWGARLYYEHFFEDHSMMFFDFVWKDMLLGLEVKLPRNPVISKFVYEYINTRDQAGPVYWDHTPEIPEQVSGADDYYHHALYPGWQHWGMGIGNPLLISPVYDNDGTLEFKHNRIKGHHFGWEGNPLPELRYRVLLSYTRSWGTYRVPTPEMEHNLNGLLEVTWTPERLRGWSGKLGIGADAGHLLGNSFGAMITISKTGWL